MPPRGASEPPLPNPGGRVSGFRSNRKGRDSLSSMPHLSGIAWLAPAPPRTPERPPTGRSPRRSHENRATAVTGSLISPIFMLSVCIHGGVTICSCPGRTAARGPRRSGRCGARQGHQQPGAVIVGVGMPGPGGTAARLAGPLGVGSGLAAAGLGGEELLQERLEVDGGHAGHAAEGYGLSTEAWVGDHSRTSGPDSLLEVRPCANAEQP